MCSKKDIVKLLAPINQEFKDRKSAILSVMSLAGPGAIFNPVQIQKVLFLLDEHAKERSKSPLFNFSPYKYGPFDQDVYIELDELHRQNCVEILPGQSYKRFVLKPKGFETVEKHSVLDNESKNALKRLVEWVLEQNFIELVKAIYDVYPNTRSRSVVT